MPNVREGETLVWVLMCDRGECEGGGHSVAVFAQGIFCQMFRQRKQDNRGVRKTGLNMKWDVKSERPPCYLWVVHCGRFLLMFLSVGEWRVPLSSASDRQMHSLSHSYTFDESLWWCIKQIHFYFIFFSARSTDPIISLQFSQNLIYNQDYIDGENTEGRLY